MPVVIAKNIFQNQIWLIGQIGACSSAAAAGADNHYVFCGVSA
jgi:hypothetical protein